SPYNWLVMISPQHRAYILAAGWSKKDVRQFLYEHARFTRRDLWEIGRTVEPTAEEANETYAAVESPDDILVLTGGGDAGGFSCVVPPWAAQVQPAITRRIRKKGE